MGVAQGAPPPEACTRPCGAAVWPWWEEDEWQGVAPGAGCRSRWFTADVWRYYFIDAEEDSPAGDSPIATGATLM